jgi:nucleotide-binding universal stress UspA family protein
MFKRILVPVDGSPVSGLGLKTAIRMAKSGKAAADAAARGRRKRDGHEAATATTQGPAQIDQLLKDLRANWQQDRRQGGRGAKKQGVTAKTVLVEKMAPGRVADVIVAQARKLRADVIVLGTHGRDGIQRIVDGQRRRGSHAQRFGPGAPRAHTGSAHEGN